MPKKEGRRQTPTKNKTKKRTETPRAHTPPPLPAYSEGYCSQFDTLVGATIDGKVVAHKMGATGLKHLQKTLHLRYWKTRPGVGALADNADIGGHAAACRRARKGNLRGLSRAQYKGMNRRYPNSYIQHLRNRRYDPTALASEQTCTREVIDIKKKSENSRNFITSLVLETPE